MILMIAQKKWKNKSAKEINHWKANLNLDLIAFLLKFLTHIKVFMDKINKLKK